MSTGNETVQPSPVDPNPQQVDPNATAQAAVADQPGVIDVDDAELSEALAAVKAEENEPASQETGVPQPPAQQQAASTEPPARAPTMIPKARLDEVLGAKEKIERENAYLRGQLDARTQPAAAAQQQPAAAAPTPEQRLKAIRDANDVLAEQFDNGDISMKAFKAEERKLHDQEQAIREEALLSRVRPAPQPQQQAGGSDELYLETLTANLETQHPWMQVYEQVGSKADWDFLTQRARENLAERGIDTTKKTPMATFELRKEVARLGDELGPSLVGSKATAKGIQIPATQQQQPPQQQQPQGKPALSQAAQARANGLKRAEAAPPDLARLSGHAGEPDGVPTDSRIENMSEDEIGNMPVNVRRKMMGYAV